MLQRLAGASVAILTTWVISAGVTEASCAGSNIAVAPIQKLSGVPVITVVWRIEPACDVVDTGLLFGTDPDRLSPVGQPIHSYREFFHQDIAVSETGGYWVVAYARDEAGSVIQSRPGFVIITVPPPLPSETQGSHGAPPSYTRTDDDFLLPAGEPHFASLKAMNVMDSNVLSFAQFELTSGRRMVASTSRDVVQSEQSQPFQLGSRTIIVNIPTLQSALNRLDERFRAFPRPGLYAVDCTAFFSLVASCVDVRDRFHVQSRQFRAETIPRRGNPTIVTNSSESNATFFIPRLRAGRRIRTARLQGSFQAVGRITDFPDGLRLNGKARKRSRPLR